MFIQSFNFVILVYIPTKILLCRHMPQFKENLCPAVMLAHVRQLLIQIYINDIYVYCTFVESLHYKVLIFCLCGLFGVNSLLILTTLPYNFSSAIQGGCQLLLKLSITDLYVYFILV